MAEPSRATFSGTSWRAASLLLPFLLYGLLWLANPIGYVGGGYDDWHYLNAARCMAESGWCIPENHWAARWPLNGPLALALRLVADERAALSLVVALYGLGVLALLLHHARWIAGHTAAVLAALLFVATPVTGFALLTVNIDIPELFFLLCGAALARQHVIRGGAHWALLAGLCFGIAFATRETAAATIVALVLVAVWHRWWHLLAWAVAGMASAFAAEALFHLLASGDALLRLKLALGHTQIASTEMNGGTTNAFPLFNPSVIASWKPAAEIDVHWLIRPLVNLLLHPWSIMLLAAGLIAGLLNRQPEEPMKRGLWLVAITSLLLLAYGFAIDPKPRMFMPTLVVAAIFAGAGLRALFTSGRKALSVVALALLVLGGLRILTAFPGVAAAEQMVRNLEARQGAPFARANETSQRALVLAERWGTERTTRGRVSLSNAPCGKGALLERAFYGGLWANPHFAKVLSAVSSAPPPLYLCIDGRED